MCEEVPFVCFQVCRKCKSFVFPGSSSSVLLGTKMIERLQPEGRFSDTVNMSSLRASSLWTTAVLGVVTTVAAIHLTCYAQKWKKRRANEDQSGVLLTLPDWAKDGSMYEKEYSTDDEKMALAIQLALTNIQEQTGGPFGCAIFERNIRTGKSKLVSVGVNRVMALNNCTCHGEVVAIQFAQSKLGCFSLRQAKADIEYDLYTSCEPCCMCLGATLWSGVSRLVCSATKADAMAIGFDEGPVYDSSYEHLEQAGVSVTKQVLHKEGAEVLKKYGETGVIYNR